MNLLLLHASKQRGDFHMFRGESHGRDYAFDVGNARRVRCVKIFFVYHSDDGVDRASVNGQSRKTVFGKYEPYIFHRGVFFHRDDVNSRNEYVADFRVVEFDRARDKFGFVVVESAVLLRFFYVGEQFFFCYNVVRLELENLSQKNFPPRENHVQRVENYR